MFKRHLLPAGDFEEIQVLAHNNQLTLVLCVLLLLLAAIIVSERRKLSLILRTLISHRHFSIIQREGKLMKDKSMLLVLTYDVLAISTGITMFAAVYVPAFLANLPFIARVGLCFTVLVAAYFFKLFCYELYSYMFDIKKERVVVIQYKFVFITDFAMAIFPFLIIVAYAKINAFFYMISVVLGLLFVAWMYRLIKINQGDGRSFNFFLYFCTLEILPWLVAVKFVVSI